MKKIVCGAVFCALSCSLLLGGCLHNSISIPKKTITGNFFDGENLAEYGLGWLEKPSGAVDEEQTIVERVTYAYRYSAYIADPAVFENYTENVFEEFKSRNYTTAYFIDTGNAGDYWDHIDYQRVALSDNLEDYKTPSAQTYFDHTGYKFYYTYDGLENYSERFGGKYMINAKCLYMYMDNDANEQGLHKIVFELYYDVENKGRNHEYGGTYVCD